jgi:HAE1 family hydrophobic/amphiphilic exporter-1
MPGVLDAQLTVGGSPMPELRLLVDREAARHYGVQADQVGQTVAFALRGNRIEPLKTGDDTLEVGTRFGLDDRRDVERVLDFPVYTAAGAPVPIRSLVRVEAGDGPSEIQRRDGVLDARISVDLAKDADREAVWADVQASLTDLRLPRGYAVDDSEIFGDIEDDASAMLRVLAMSIAFVFLIMAMLFESWLLPLAILTSVPLGLAGVYWGLYLTGSPFDTMSGVGLVILVGIVVNNGIVLIDLVGQLRSEGYERSTALVEGARRRLRPILMTALTAIIGLAPMAVGSSSFIGIPYAPLGRTVMSGLLVSTVLTLFYVPIAYALLDDLKDAAWSWRGLFRRSPS